MSVHPLIAYAEPVEVPGAFEAFYEHHYVRVLILVRRHFPRCDAEDIAQETMTRCYLHFGRLQSGRDPWPWVNSVARNIAIDAMRKDRRMASVDDLPEATMCTAPDATYDATLARERRRTLDRALKQLRPADRQLIEDHDLDDFACAELAAMLDLSPNTLRQKLHRARRKLALELRRGGGAFGVAGALHGRLARVARRADDAVTAAGSASAAAFGAIAAASLATTVAAILGGTPAGAAVPRVAVPVAAFGPERAADRAVAMPRTEAPRVAAVTRGGTAAAPRGPKPAPVPVTLSTGGDPIFQPGDESEQTLMVDTPIGPVGIDQHNEHTPGLAQACEILSCP